MGRILVIEDDAGTQVLLRGRLHELGHEVVMAGTGAMGLMEARAQSFDLFIVDIHLGSGIDGYEVCRRVKAIPQMRSIPVVLLSGQVSTREELHRGYEAGCEAFLMKGDSNLLEDTVRVMLRVKSLQDELAYQNQLLAQQARTEVPGNGNGSQLAAALDTEEAREVVYQELGYGRPDGVLLADADGICRFADRGARDLLGKDLEGRHLGSVVPASRLEAYVRDAKTARHEGYGMDLTLRKGGVERHLSATVVPLAPRPGEPTRPMRVVLLQDASRRRVAADLVRLNEPVPRRVIGPLLEAARSIYRPASLLGASQVMVDVRATLERTSKTRIPVWVHGEPGAGRHSAARILHFSGFHSGSLVPMDCRAIAPEAAEAELFGQAQGKGVESSRPGAFQLAHLGTLILFEPETLPLEVQAKIAEAVPEGKVRRIGSRKAESAEVRLVVITGEDPAAVEADGRIDPALARLIEERIHIPPLRERTGDTTLLARHLLERLTREGQPCELSEEALWVMEQHDWPGNVRELESSIERAVEKAGSSVLTGEDLPRPLADLYRRYQERNQIPALAPRSRPLAPGDVETALPTMTLSPLANPLEEEPVSLELYEKHCLQRALRETGGDKLAAARLLKVGKSTLYRKLKRYGIS